MAEPTLESIVQQLERVLVELRSIRQDIRDLKSRMIGVESAAGLFVRLEVEKEQR